MAELSDKQLEANRANAQKSTGPKTEAGKRRSSLNAVRHGLTGHVVVLPSEDLGVLEEYTRSIMSSFHDLQGALEISIAENIANTLWRVRRAAAAEDNMLSLGLMEEVAENLNLEHAQIHNAASNAKTFRHQSRVFNTMSLYTQRLHNQAQRLMAQLKALQDERHEREREQMIEAARVYKFKKMQGEEFEPVQNGFVYSTAEIEAYIQVQTVKRHAEIAEFCQFKRDWFLKKVA